MRRHLLALLLAFTLILPALASDVEKKGYIVNNNGDTVFGKIFLRKELGAISNIQLFTQVRFADSTGPGIPINQGQLRVMASHWSTIQFCRISFHSTTWKCRPPSELKKKMLSCSGK
jgi:hypothetical protein